MFKSLLFLAGCRSSLSMSKIKVKISETKFLSFYKTSVKPIISPLKEPNAINTDNITLFLLSALIYRLYTTLLDNINPTQYWHSHFPEEGVPRSCHKPSYLHSSHRRWRSLPNLPSTCWRSNKRNFRRHVGN